MSRKLGLGWIAFLSIFSLLVLNAAWVTAGLVLASVKSFIWLGVGLVVYWAVNRFLFATPKILKTGSHELDHALVCCLFLKKVTEFNVREDSGEIYHVRGGIVSSTFISLAPYCLPLFSYVLLVFKPFIDAEFVWLADLMIGVVTAFHFHCFREQTHMGQSDITQFGSRWMPLWFIYAFRFFNLMVILRSLLPGLNVFKAYIAIFEDFISLMRTIIMSIF